MSAEQDIGDGIVAEGVPLHAGCLALRITLAAGDAIVGLDGPHGPLPLLAHHRLLQSGRREHLLVIEADRVETDGLHVDVETDDGDLATYPLALVPARWSRSLSTLLRSALLHLEEDAPDERNFSALGRFLSEISLQAARARLSIPIAGGIALVLDGDLGGAPREIPCFVSDTRRLVAAEAQVATEPGSGRAILFSPVAGARVFLALDDALVEIACPHGASRTRIAAAPGAPAATAAEIDLLLSLVAAAGAGDQVDTDTLAVATALPSSWTAADLPPGCGLSVAGLVPTGRGTAVFLSGRDAVDALAALTLEDLTGEVVPLFDGAAPVASFRPSDEPGIAVAAVLPGHPPGGVLRVALGDTRGRWLRLLDPAGGEAARLVAAWAPPAPAKDYRAAVALPLRTDADPAPLPRLIFSGDGAAAEPAEAARVAVLLLAAGAAPAARERSLLALALTAGRAARIVVTLASGPGFDAEAADVAALAAAFGLRVSVAPTAPGAGLAGHLGRAAGLAPVVVAVEAGAVPRATDWMAELADLADAVVLPAARIDQAERPCAAAFAGAGRAVFAEVEPRLSTLHAFARAAAAAAAARGIAVYAATELDFAALSSPACAERLAFAALVDGDVATLAEHPATEPAWSLQ